MRLECHCGLRAQASPPPSFTASPAATSPTMVLVSSRTAQHQRLVVYFAIRFLNYTLAVAGAPAERLVLGRMSGV